MQATRFLIVGLAVAVIVFSPGEAAAGGGGGGGGGPCAGFASGTTLIMRDSCFDGVAHFVDAGKTLLVRNEGHAPHSFTAVDGSFDTGLLDPGETAEIPLGASGLTRAYCTLHGSIEGHGMAGLLVVGKPSAQAIRAAAPATHLERSLAEHDAGLMAELSAQGERLAQVEQEMAGLKEAVRASHADQLRRLSAPTALGLLGVVLGGVALAGVYRRPAAREEAGTQEE